MKHDFHALAVAQVRRETADAMSYALEVPPPLRAAFRFAPGQHLAVRATLAGEEIGRTYSISSGPADTRLWITIKRVPGGAFSTWAQAALVPGATLDCMPPAGRFVLPAVAEAPGRLIAIAAGSGITPVISIVEHALVRDPARRITLIYGNRTVDDIIFRERLEGLKNRHLERLQIFHVLSRDAEADVPLLAGRIDADKLRTLLAHAPPGPDDRVFLCGPGSLITDARDTLTTLGVARSRLHFEYFRAGPQMAARPTSAAVASPAPVAIGAEVVAVLDGARRVFQVAPGQHVIDAALAAGIKLPYSCKGGMCCTCRAKLVEGQVTMDRNFSLEAWEMDAGFVLTCQARPTTDRVVLDYDRV